VKEKSAIFIVDFTCAVKWVASLIDDFANETKHFDVWGAINRKEFATVYTFSFE